MRPDIVSLGAQKCFAAFTDQMKKDETIVPTVNYYQHVVAKIILFRKMEKIVLSQKFGGYKANIVAYTYYKLMCLSKQRLDLDYIWKNQNISKALEEEITILCKLIQSKIVNSSGGANIGELCKSHKCINMVDEIDYELSNELSKELLDSPAVDDLIEEGEDAAELTEEERAVVNEAKSISTSEWKNIFNWSEENNSFEAWERTLLFRIASLLDTKKAPSFADSDKGLDLREEALRRGFSNQ